MKNLFLLLISVFTFNLLIAEDYTFTPEKLWKLKRLGGGSVSPSEDFILYNLTSYDVDKNSGSTEYYIYSLDNGESKTLSIPDEGAKNLRWLEDNTIAYMLKKENRVEIKSFNLDNQEVKVIKTLSNASILDFKIAPKKNYLLTLEKITERKRLGREIYSWRCGFQTFL